MKSKVVMNTQARLFDSFPRALRRFSDIRFALPYMFWQAHPNGFKHTASMLSPLYNKYTGCRCVILGNGPSLRKMDLSILKNEFTFGLNRIYLIFDEIGFETTFLVAVNRTVLNQFLAEMLNTNSLKLLNWLHRGSHIPDEKTAFTCVKPWKSVDGNILKGYSGSVGTVTTVAIETAFFMGFSEVILIGVDHSYVEKGTPGLTVVSKGSDPNHFDPNYFGKGITWQLPDFEAMERGYRIAQELYRSRNRSIFDATLNGNLHIFPKVDFYKHLANSSYMNKCHQR